MNRRTLLGVVGTGIFGSIAGCSESKTDTPQIHPVLNIGPEAEPLKERQGDWKLTARIENEYDLHTVARDVALVTFGESGEEVGQASVGPLGGKNHPIERTVSVTCSAFPAIVTATAARSPCDGVRIYMYYVPGGEQAWKSWNGDRRRLWENTYRTCDEQLPPERVLEQMDGEVTDSGPQDDSASGSYQFDTVSGR